METTLILLKPDSVMQNQCGEILSRFEKAGFKIRGCKMIKLSDAILKDHYSHLTSKPFYPEIQSFMQSSPVLALALEGENAVERIREMVGPTDSRKAAKGSIRGDLGQDMMKNNVHASDSVETAKAELKRFFKAEELFSY